MLRKEKTKKKFRQYADDEDFRPKRKRITPRQKYKSHQIWLVEEEEIDMNWKEEQRYIQSE